MAHLTMVKKRFADGHTCQKCAQAEALLKQRGHWGRVDQVVWADEGDAASPGNQLAREHGVELAPFFVARDARGERVYTSVLALIKKEFGPAEEAAPPAPAEAAVMELVASARSLAGKTPAEIVRLALERFGSDCAIAFSGAEDVVLIHLAAQTGKSFRVFSLDTGRLHPETYRFIERVRERYGVPVELVSPDRVALEDLVRDKGLFSFYADGHEECCSIRKVEPLRRRLSRSRAWMTGQRRDQSPTRTEVDVIEIDRINVGASGPLVKFNPLAHQSLGDVWSYIREHDIPRNELHERGFVSIGCEPCTRAIRPGEHERAGRWWWEDATKRECGLHVGNLRAVK
jgi:phosphoadenosine phosphosulfate reductase